MINGNVYRSMIVSAANNIANLQDEINKLNVFPVPDGDTGTNMSLTMQAGKNAVDNFNGGVSRTAGKGSNSVASALLRGGRGNSGVILSLFFRGVTKELKGLSEASPADFARAFKGGVESAYKAVRKPTEGTVLTVMRLCADRAAEIADSGITDAEFFAELLANAKDTLAKTPDMLPTTRAVWASVFCLKVCFPFLTEKARLPHRQGLLPRRDRRTLRPLIQRTSSLHIAPSVSSIKSPAFIKQKKR